MDNTPTTQEDFNNKYWFSPLQMVTLVNPRPEDYTFMVEMRHYVIRSGVKEEMPGTIANVYLSQMTRILAQEDDRMELLSDFALVSSYYERLIVGVRNMVDDSIMQPAYMSRVPESIKAETPQQPPWKTEASTEQQSSPTESADNDAPPKAVESKEFEQGGHTYRSVVNKKGNVMHYRDNALCSPTEYNKAASML